MWCKKKKQLQHHIVYFEIIDLMMGVGSLLKRCCFIIIIPLCSLPEYFLYVFSSSDYSFSSVAYDSCLELTISNIPVLTSVAGGLAAGRAWHAGRCTHSWVLMSVCDLLGNLPFTGLPWLPEQNAAGKMLKINAVCIPFGTPGMQQLLN